MFTSQVELEVDDDRIVARCTGCGTPIVDYPADAAHVLGEIVADVENSGHDLDCGG